MDKIRREIIDSQLSKSDKRKLLKKLSLNSLTESDYEKIKFKKVVVQKEAPKVFFLLANILRFFSSLGIIKYLILLFIFMSLWTYFTQPGGIKVRAFPGTILKVRSSLGELKHNLPEYYKLVTQNTDEINVDYIEQPNYKGGHAFVKNGKQIVRIFHPHHLETPYLTQLLVHEACHGHQGINGRFGNEPQQKLESECQYLGVYIIETLFPQEKELLKYLYSEATNPTGVWGDGWKKSWDLGDTTQGLSKLLPKEKITEYKYFGNNYKY